MKKKYFQYMIVFFIPVISILIYMTINKCYPFGDNTILLGDGEYQYYAFFKELIKKIKGGSLSIWDWNGGMGHDYFPKFFYYLASPINIIGILIGFKDAHLGMVITVIVQWSLTGVTMLYYLKHTKVVNNNTMPYKLVLQIIFALSYSMSNFLLTYQHNYIWLISLIMAPLVMLGVEQLVNEKKKKLYFVSMIIVFITNFYFAWYICILSLIWFFIQDIKNLREFTCNGIRYVLTSLLAAMVSCAVLIPCYYTVLFCNRKDRAYVYSASIQLFDNIANFFQGFFWAHYIDTSSMQNSSYADLGYCGIFVLILFSVYFFNKEIHLNKRIKRLVISLLLIFCLIFYYTNYVLQGFSYTIGNPSRFAFIFTLLLIVTGYESVCKISKIDIKYLLLILFAYAGVVAVVLSLNTDVQNLFCYMGSILLVVYLFLCFLFYTKNSINKRALIMNIVIIAFLELISNFFIGTRGSYSSVLTEQSVCSDKWVSVYNNLNLKKGERKTVYIGDNIDCENSNTDMFSSTLNGNMVDLFAGLGLNYVTTGRVYSYKCTTPLTAALFNVRYVLTDNLAYYGGFKISDEINISDSNMDSKETFYILDNGYISGLGFVFNENITNWKNSLNNPIDNQNAFTESILKSGKIFEEVSLHSINTETKNIEIYNANDKQYNYVCSDNDICCLQCTYKVPKNMDMYMYFSDSTSVSIDVYIDGKKLMPEQTVAQIQHTLHIGEVSEGQEITVQLYVNGIKGMPHVARILAYEFDDTIMQKCMLALDQKYLVENLTGSGVKGTVDVKTPGVLCASIPYYEGMTVYVDGKKQKIVKIADSLCGVRLSEGTHVVEYKYFPYGLKLGIILSCLGIVISLIYMIKRKITANKYCVKK